MKKIILILLAMLITIGLSSCITQISVSDDEMQMMNDFIIALRDEDFGKAVELEHPWAEPTEEGLKDLVQGLSDDNMMFEGDMTFSICYDVKTNSGRVNGVAYIEKTYTSDYVVGELKYTIKFVVLNADKHVGIEKISIALCEDE